MRDRIHLLPDSVANQIAAGEVIQRPASVIKELVENAVDAGADSIDIVIRDAGRTLIQVIDNGHGMSETDARMAFERHATSKITSADDLFTLHTMGFRGEALPSICAVSMVEVRSRLEGTHIGTKLTINGSRVESQEPEMCEKGTNLMVKNLFFNVPARRKFLKSDSVELANIHREFERLALVNPAVAFSLDTGGKILRLRKGTLLQRISELWRGSLESQIIPVQVDTSIVKINGFVSRPEYARRRNALQFLTVNGRNFKHPYFHRAILNCYSQLIAADTMPCYFINFEVDPASIDVNIHPTKNEIKFEEESHIWSILTAAVKGSLGKFSAVPTIDFEEEAIELQPLKEGEKADKPDAGISLAYNPFNVASTKEKGREFHIEREKTKNWEELYRGFVGEKRKTSVSPSGSGETETTMFSNEEHCAPAFLCLQYAEKYIVTVTRRGVVIIDQYRAHLKILYEQFLNKSKGKGSVSQTLLFPETIELSREQELALEECEAQLVTMGLVLEKSDNGSYLIVGVPPVIAGSDPREFVMFVLESLSDDTDGIGSGKRDETQGYIASRTALAIARSLAVKRGRKLSPEEMEEIIGELFKLPDSSLSPDGKKIFTIVDEDFISGLLF